jgi:hypothetical protein
MKEFAEYSDLHPVIVHTFNMSDVEDPDLWAAQSLYEWEKTSSGEWIMKSSLLQPTWHRIWCDYGWQYQVKAYLSDKDYTFYKLKYE